MNCLSADIHKSNITKRKGKTWILTDFRIKEDSWEIEATKHKTTPARKGNKRTLPEQNGSLEWNNDELALFSATDDDNINIDNQLIIIISYMC